MEKTEHNRTTIGFLCGLTCFSSVISQMPQFVSAGMSRIFSLPLWLLLFAAVIFLQKPKTFPKFDFPIFVYLVLTVFLAFSVFVTMSYYNSVQVYNLFLSLFVLITSCMVGTLISEDDIDFVIACYIVPSVAVAIGVFVKYLMGRGAAGRVYLYGSKNSVSQILLTAVILMLMELLNQRTRKKLMLFFYIFGIAFLTYCILMLKSRASIVAIPVIALMIVFKKENVDKKVKIGIIAALFIIVLILIFDRSLYDSLVNDVLLGNRDADDLNSISSGRWSDWVKFPTELSRCFVFGQGSTYRESFILSILLVFGVPLGSLLIAWSLYPFVWAIKNRKSDSIHVYTLLLVSLTYSINSVFEEQAPFGPGVKCFFLWMFFGLLLSRQKKKENEDQKKRILSDNALRARIDSRQASNNSDAG